MEQELLATRYAVQKLDETRGKSALLWALGLMAVYVGSTVTWLQWIGWGMIVVGALLRVRVEAQTAPLERRLIYLELRAAGVYP